MIESQAPVRSHNERYTDNVVREVALPWWHDLRIVTVFFVVIMAATSLPYLFAYLVSPPDRRFQGIVFNLADHVQYFSWLRDHRTDWLVANRMTPEPNVPALFNLLWLIVGRIEAFTGWSVPALFQGVRLVAAASLLLVLAPVCRLFTRGGGEQWLAYTLVVLGSGLGWIWVVEKHMRGLSDVRFPLDLYVGEPNTFFSIMAFPHFVIACSLVMAIFWYYLRALEMRSWPLALAVAALALSLTLQHAYDLFIIGIVPACFLALVALRDRRIPWFGGFSLALIGCLAMPPALYFTLLTSRDPLWRAVLAQFGNAGVYTPPPPHLVILMGLPLILTLVSLGLHLVGTLRVRGWAGLLPADNRNLFLWTWFGVGYLLLYVPTDFQIHMLNSWQVPVALLAARAVYRQFKPTLANRASHLAQALPLLIVLAVIPTNLYLTVWRITELSRFEEPYYLSGEEQEALEWLATHADRDTVVLSGLKLGQFVPVYSDGRTFLGHWAQTVAFFDKRERVQAFFDVGRPDEERLALLDQFQVNYVLYGPEERSLGAYSPADSPLFEAVFNRDSVTIYRVRPWPPSEANDARAVSDPTRARTATAALNTFSIGIVLRLESC